MGHKQRMGLGRETNMERQSEIDLAKSIMILCLPLIHCIIDCTPEELLVSGIPYLFDTIIGGPLSAPIYMFAMGIGVAYRPEQRGWERFRRGIFIFLMGFLLNICRFSIPHFIRYCISGDIATYMEEMPYYLFENDILQFAGLALMVLSLCEYFKIKDLHMLIMAWVLSFLGTLCNGLDMNLPVWNISLGYLVGTEDVAGMVKSYFPLFNWLLFPVSGLVFGKKLLYVKDKKRFYGVLAGIGIPMSLIMYGSGIILERGMFGEGQNCYYHLQTIDAFTALCSTLSIFGICYFVIDFLPNRILLWAKNISEHITSIYCIHWVLIGISVYLVLYTVRGTTELPVHMSLLWGVMIGIASIVLANIWTGIKNRIRRGC